MTELQRYLAEEVAEDHADGIITRREAVRRLALLGVGAGAAATLLGATATDAAAKHGHRGHADHGRNGGQGGQGGHGGPGGHGGQGGQSEAVDWAPVATEAVTFTGPAGQLMAAWAPAAGRMRGAVLVIHENRGLNDHIRNVAGRFAASGYAALALDLLSEEGGTAAFPGEAEVAAALSAAPPARFDADMKAAVTELRRRAPRAPIAAIGFCFGGGMVWRLLAAGEDRLDAAAPFYGPFPQGGDLSGAKAAVLGIYGGLDARVNATRDAARAALEAAGLDHRIVTFAAADHAFFNDTGPRFNAPAAEEAWHRVLSWFGGRPR
ncbi:MAG: carboxymethylenebutenolidase [Solirubrobacteraceae bacterium]|nr:carboxymethylenebutenolidase [Solirubrobacteraceae bacterium]